MKPDAPERAKRYAEGGPATRESTDIGQRVADLEFQIRLLVRNLHNLEVKLQEAHDEIQILRQPRDVRYVPAGWRGRP